MNVDGVIHFDATVRSRMNKSAMLWGQAKKVFLPLADALQAVDERSLRDFYVSDPRALGRLNSASAKVSGKWLDAFPQSWWPQFHDTSFIMALRFRCGMKVSAGGQKCMHTKIKDSTYVCE